MSQYTYIDLFCGAGGLSLGFNNAGFKNILSVEFNPVFASTYKHNFPDHNLIVDDIKNISNDDLKLFANLKDVDVIIGGPPCQGFSIAGNIARNFVDDERNHLFKEFVRFVSILQPKIFVMENVANLAKHRNGKTIEEITKEFEKSGVGYEVIWKVLNSVNYGIAQKRRRIVIVGIRKNIHTIYEFPLEEENVLTIKDVIDDLPPLESGESSNIPNHNAMNHTKQMLEKMRYVQDGGNRFDIPEEIRPKSGDSRKYIRYNSKEPSFCITGDMRKVFHYNQNRALTSRELARIQSFPDTFIFLGSSIQIQQQIGNAVPPILAYKIAKKIKEALENAKISKS